MRTPVALPPNFMQGEKESAMRRRRSQPRSFKENLQAEKARLEAAFENIEPGPERDLLERKLRQIEAHKRVVKSPGLQAPK